MSFIVIDWGWILPVIACWILFLILLIFFMWACSPRQDNYHVRREMKRDIKILKKDAKFYPGSFKH